MRPANALAEDLRRFGLILLVAGVVGGFLRSQVGHASAVYAAVVGVGLLIVGYWLHQREHQRAGSEDTL